MVELITWWIGYPVIDLNHQSVKLETRKAAALLAYLSIEARSFPCESLASLF